MAKDNTQFKLMLPHELGARLSEYARRYKRGTANKVALEILEFYHQAWAAGEEARRAVFLQQTAGVGALPPMVHLRDTLEDEESAAPKVKRS